MIIVRSPLRISLGGGGTDLPSYYKKENGFVLSAAINKYVYVTITRPFSKGIYLKYSEIEKVTDPKKIKHKIIREALLDQKLKFPQIEITTLLDKSIFFICPRDLFLAQNECLSKSSFNLKSPPDGFQFGPKPNNLKPIAPYL